MKSASNQAGHFCHVPITLRPKYLYFSKVHIGANLNARMRFTHPTQWTEKKNRLHKV